MVNQADEPLTKITINIFKSDYDWFKARYGVPQIAIREAIRVYVNKIKADQESYNV